MVMAEPVTRSSIRLAELLAVLSLATDLGMGQPMEHVLRQCLISLRLAQRLGLHEADRVVVYYAALIAWVGCHVDAYEQAKWFGDDLALKADFRRVDFASAAAGPMFMMGHLGAGRPVAERARLGVAFLGGGRRAAEEMLENHWLAADALAARLGLDQQVRDSVEQTFERWDGRGVPKGAKGEEILLTSRLVTLADVVEVFQRALQGLSRRTGLLAGGGHRVVRPSVLVRGWPVPPQRSWISSAAIETAVSSGVRAPRSSPIGERSRASSSSVRPASRSRARRSSWVRRLPMAPM
jgi:hypothetical protein